MRALLLHYVGERVYDIHKVEKGGKGDTYEETNKSARRLFQAEKIGIYIHIYSLRCCKQKDGKTLDEYVT